MNWAVGADHLDAEAGEPFRRVVGSDRGDDAVHVVVHALVADGRVGRHDAEGRGGAHEVRAPRRGDQRLGGNAAVVEAVPAHLVLLDQHHRHAELGRRRPPRTGRPSRRRSRTGRRASRRSPCWQRDRAGRGCDGHVRRLRRRSRRASSRPRGHLAAAWLFLHLLRATGMSATTPRSNKRQHQLLGDERARVDGELAGLRAPSATHAHTRPWRP